MLPVFIGQAKTMGWLICKYSLVFRQLDKVVIGDGWLSGTCGSHKHERYLMGQVAMQEERLDGRLSCWDDQLTHLEGKGKGSGL